MKREVSVNDIDFVHSFSLRIEEIRNKWQQACKSLCSRTDYVKSECLHKIYEVEEAVDEAELAYKEAKENLKVVKSALQHYDPDNGYECYNRLKNKMLEAQEDLIFAHRDVRRQRFRLETARAHFSRIQNAIERINSLVQTYNPDNQLFDCINFISRYADSLRDLSNI